MAQAGKTNEDLDTLRADLAALRQELANVVTAVKELGEHAVSTARRQRGVAADHLVAEAQSLAGDAVTAGRDQLDELERRVRERPLAAVGIAFMVGLLFGSLRR